MNLIPLRNDIFSTKLRKVNRSRKCDVSLKQFQQHLGVHMQQLALAALYKITLRMKLTTIKILTLTKITTS